MKISPIGVVQSCKSGTCYRLKNDDANSENPVTNQAPNFKAKTSRLEKIAVLPLVLFTKTINTVGDALFGDGEESDHHDFECASSSSDSSPEDYHSVLEDDSIEFQARMDSTWG